MLRWISLALVLATNVAAFTNSPAPESKGLSNAPSQCQALAWVRAPDMVPGEVITGDVKIKLSGPCIDAESYTLGLRYKENVFWKLRREDAPIPKMYKLTYTGMASRANRNLIHNNLWSMHEEERIAFEIKSPLAGAEKTGPLSRNFTSEFGVLVPNTNYPPGLDCRIISSESIYEYFVEIGFSDGTTSEIRAGITAFTPFALSTEITAPSINVSLSPAPAHSGSNMKPSIDRLRSNYTIEVSFPEGAYVYRNSSVNITAIVHRTGYTNRTDIPVELCASSANDIEWRSQELQNRSRPVMPSIGALVPSVFARVSGCSQVSRSTCSKIKFGATPVPLTHESHIFSTSSEPLSLSLSVQHNAVPDFSTYYQKLGHGVKLNLRIAPDPSEPWDNEHEKMQWEKQIADADELDWTPWMPIQRPRRLLSGNVNVLSVIPMQEQGLVRSTPVHYLSDKARQPIFVNASDIADLRLMLPEERDLIAPLAHPSVKVFAQGEERPRRYYAGANHRYPIYVGDTWVKKVLPVAPEGQHETDHLFVVQ
ncbi:hypothetical protein BDR04DRAFT_1122396 [Suillus decipiens]|nr:hypothetical protein BDR04DRAFT_1122396 [Suillus decipiens]